MKSKTRWLIIFCVALWHYNVSTGNWRIVSVFETLEACQAAKTRSIVSIIPGAYQPMGMCLSAS